MISGIHFSEDALESFTTFTQRSGKEHKGWYMIFNMDDSRKNIIVEKEALKSECPSDDAKANWSQFAGELPQQGCRIAAYNFPVVEGTSDEKWILIFWASDEAQAADKMTWSATVKEVKGKIGGRGGIWIQANDKDDISYDTVAGIVKSSKK